MHNLGTEKTQNMYIFTSYIWQKLSDKFSSPNYGVILLKIKTEPQNPAITGQPDFMVLTNYTKLENTNFETKT